MTVRSPRNTAALPGSGRGDRVRSRFRHRRYGSVATAGCRSFQEFLDRRRADRFRCRGAIGRARRMNRLERLYAVAEAIRRRAPAPVSAAALAEEFGVTRRTMER